MAYLPAPDLDLPAQVALPPAAAAPASPVAAVLHLINGEHYAGAERVQDLLALRLPECGVRVGLACLKPRQFPLVRQTVSAPWYDCSMRGRLDLRPARQVAELVRREGYQALHSHTPRAALIAHLAARWTGVPWIHHVHSPTNRDSTRQWQNRINTLLERWSLRCVTAVVAVSRSLGQWAQSLGVPEERLFVVPNGVPGCAALPPRTAPQDAWTLGTIALFRPRKGLEVLLDALAQLRATGAPVRLRAVGTFETPEYQTEILARAQRLGLLDAIDWIGFTRDITGQLAQIDLFVLPSLFGEGMPMVVLEALAAGLPVIASQVEGVPEVVRHGGEGLLVPPGKPEPLADAIRQFVDRQVPWDAMRRSAWNRHALHFSDRAMAEGVAQVYRQCLPWLADFQNPHALPSAGHAECGVPAGAVDADSWTNLSQDTCPL